MSYTKATITKKYEDELELTPVEARESLEALLEIMKSSLESGEEILISGFGKFQVKEKAPRKGRNPATGENLILEKRRVVTFKWAGKLREALNKESQDE